jgi:hypothetical protein
VTHLRKITLGELVRRKLDRIFQAFVSARRIMCAIYGRVMYIATWTFGLPAYSDDADHLFRFDGDHYSE